MQEWQGFAERQAQRYVPAPPNPARAVLQESACHRLRVLHVDNLPPPQLSSGVEYGLQLGVTLFDQDVGQYYGSTCWSQVEALQGEQQQQWDSAEEEGATGADTNSSSGAPVDFSFDVFFHSNVADAHCMAVVSWLWSPAKPRQAGVAMWSVLATRAWHLCESLTTVVLKPVLLPFLHDRLSWC